MEFIINRVYFTKKLEELQKIINTKAHIPILQGLKLTLTNNELSLIAGNEDEFLNIVIPTDDEEANLKVQEVGSIVAVNSQLIIQFTKKATADTITFTSDENKIQLKSGRAKFNNGIGESSSQYPQIPVFNETNPSFKLKGFDLKKYIQNTIFASSTNESRPVLTGVKFSFNEDGLELLATDSHRLSRVKVEGVKTKESQSIVVPSKTLKDLLPILDDEELIHIQYSANNISFKFKNTLFVGRLLEGKYPDTSRLIPSNPPIQIKLNRKDLINAVSIVSVIESQSNIITFTGNIDSPTLALESAAAMVGKINDEVETVSYVGEEARLSLRAKYVLDALKQFDSEVITFSVFGPMRPMLIESDTETNILQLILPIRTH